MSEVGCGDVREELEVTAACGPDELLPDGALTLGLEREHPIDGAPRGTQRDHIEVARRPIEEPLRALAAVERAAEEALVPDEQRSRGCNRLGRGVWGVSPHHDRLNATGVDVDRHGAPM